MLEILTLVFLVTGSDGTLIRLEAAAAGLAAAGDTAIVYRIDAESEAVDAEAPSSLGGTWQPLARGPIVDTGSGLAIVLASDDASRLGSDLDRLRVAVTIPASRLAERAPPDDPAAALERTGSMLSTLDDQALGDAVALAIPADERVELSVLTLLQSRWATREAATTPTPTAPAAPPGSEPTAAVLPDTEGAPQEGAVAEAQTDAADAQANAQGSSFVDNSGEVPVRVEIGSADGTPPVDDDAATQALIESLPNPPSDPDAATPALESLPGAGEEPTSVGITSRIRHWAEARAAGAINDVLAFYSDRFVPADGLDRASWAAQLRASADAGMGDFVLDDLHAGFFGGTDRARVTFIERAPGDAGAHDVRLVLVWERDDWRILEERREPADETQ